MLLSILLKIATTHLLFYFRVFVLNLEDWPPLCTTLVAIYSLTNEVIQRFFFKTSYNELQKFDLIIVKSVFTFLSRSKGPMHVHLNE